MMKLHVSEYGHRSTSSPLVILHGFLGSSDNWHSLAQRFAERSQVFLLDARNHGRSPHTPEFTYSAMCEDVREFIEYRNLSSVNLLGHSMGGRTAMEVATTHPHLVDHLVVVDIAPKPYIPHHDQIFSGLRRIDLPTLRSRSEANALMAKDIASADVRQFLLKNLVSTPHGTFEWRINLAVLEESYAEVLKGLEPGRMFEGPTLFIRGSRAGYVLDEDSPTIQEFFPRSRLQSLDAGHWVHAERADEFFDVVTAFLQQST